jgi:hypothetical protein
VRARRPQCPAGAVRWAGLAVLLSVVLLIASCVHPGRRPESEPTGHRPLGTVARAHLGDHLVTTASVDRVLSTGSFVVRDSDLPPEGLLVLAVAVPDGLRPPVLVLVDGVVGLFRIRDFAWTALGDPSLYRPYEGKKALIADGIRLW